MPRGSDTKSPAAVWASHERARAALERKQQDLALWLQGLEAETPVET